MKITLSFQLLLVWHGKTGHTSEARNIWIFRYFTKILTDLWIRRLHQKLCNYEYFNSHASALHAATSYINPYFNTLTMYPVTVWLPCSRMNYAVLYSVTTFSDQLFLWTLSDGKSDFELQKSQIVGSSRSSVSDYMRILPMKCIYQSLKTESQRTLGDQHSLWFCFHRLAR